MQLNILNRYIDITRSYLRISKGGGVATGMGL